jgi:hypothetical protein
MDAVGTPYYHDNRVEPIVDGLITLFQKNLAASVRLKSDAHAGDTTLHIQNSLRFEKGEQILLMDKNSVWNPNTKTGVEFHNILEKVTESEYLKLKEPLKKDFLVDNGGWLMKTIRNARLYPKDIYYGDRAVMDWESVAICIEPESQSNEWIALQGLLSTEYKMAIMVYARMGSTNDSKNWAARVCHAYADAINRLLISNIHVDLLVDDTPLVADANPGDDFVYVSQDVAAQWPVDPEIAYDVQDNFNLDALLSIVSGASSSDVSSSSSSLSANWSSESSSLSSDSSQSSSSGRTFSSSGSSLSTDSSSSNDNPSSSSISSLSTQQTPPGVKIYLSRPLRYHFRVGDKATLRRRYRYMYDSRVTNINYAEMQKGEMVKVAHLSWFAKETQRMPFSQIGKGGSSY